LFLDGLYVYRDNRPPRFQRVKAPNKAELEELVQLISQRVGRCLERQGLLEQDAENAWLDLDPAEDNDAMPQILGSSVSYRIAVGPQQGRKAFMIRTIRPLESADPGLERVAKANRFSLHAQGSLYPEDTLSGRNDPGGLRTRGFYCTIGGPCAKTQGQSHPLPRRTGTEPPMAWRGHPGQTWQGT